MSKLIVIKLHVISYSRREFTNVFRRVEIYVLLLDAAPEAFYPYIVFTTTSTIHAYLYAIAGQQILPVLGRMLASLVRIRYFRCSVHPDTFSHQLIGIGSFQLLYLALFIGRFLKCLVCIPENRGVLYIFHSCESEQPVPVVLPYPCALYLIKTFPTVCTIHILALRAEWHCIACVPNGIACVRAEWRCVRAFQMASTVISE